MKIFLPLIFFIATSAFGATCTNTTRTNYSPNTVLTSSALNADFNQLVTKANAFDGGCVTDGTLEAASLSAIDFATVTNGIHQGCLVSYVDTNTVSVGKCILSVNGAFVKTTVTNNATWGCVGCSSEITSTQYYVYAKTGSTGTTLNLLILTTAPNADGYDALGNKALGRFYNNASNAINSGSLYTWSGFEFRKSVPLDRFTISFGDSSGVACTSDPCGYVGQSDGFVSSVNRNSTGSYTFNFTKTFTDIVCVGNFYISASVPTFASAPPHTGGPASSVTLVSRSALTPFSLTDALGSITCEGY